jgi:TonB family protein
MKKWILISAILHICLAGLLSMLTRNTSRWAGEVQVYQVDLITMQPEVQAAELNIETVSTESVPDVLSKVHIEPPPEESRTEPAEHQATRAEPAADEPKTSSGPRLQVEGEPFPYNYYLETLRKRIQENWDPPFQELDRQNKLSAVVKFRISRDGSIEHVSLEKRTGRFMFDQAAQRAIFDTGKMPPLPPEFTGRFITVHVEFESSR